MAQELPTGEIERESPADDDLDLDGDVGQEVDSVGSHVEKGLVVLRARGRGGGEGAGASGGPGLVERVEDAEPGGRRLGGGVEGEVPERSAGEEKSSVERNARRGEAWVEEAVRQGHAVGSEREGGGEEAGVAGVGELEEVVPAGEAEGAGEGGTGGGGGDERLGKELGVRGPEREGEKGLHVLDVL